MSEFRYMENVVTLDYDVDKCVGCTMCTVVCPHRLFSMEESKAVLGDRDLCMECGACAANCPVEAIAVTPGVGCASAILTGWFSGSEPVCGCSDVGGPETEKS